LSKECNFALDDLNLSVLLSDSGDLILSITKLLVRSPDANNTTYYAGCAWVLVVLVVALLLDDDDDDDDGAIIFLINEMSDSSR